MLGLYKINLWLKTKLLLFVFDNPMLENSQLMKWIYLHAFFLVQFNIHPCYNVNNLKEVIQADVFKQSLKVKINDDISFRNREVDSLKQEIQQLKARRDPHPATIHDLENVCICVVFTKFDLD